MSEFTKEQLAEIANRFAAALPNVALPRDLYEKGWLVSRLALSLLERAENAERLAIESITPIGDLLGSVKRIGAERDQARRELAEAEEAILQLCLVLPGSDMVGVGRIVSKRAWDVLDDVAREQVRLARNLPAVRRARERRGS